MYVYMVYTTDHLKKGTQCFEQDGGCSIYSGTLSYVTQSQFLDICELITISDVNITAINLVTYVLCFVHLDNVKFLFTNKRTLY